MNINEIYDDLSKTLCNQDKVLKELIWFINRNKKLNRPKNALLIGEFGTGKTTIVEQISQKMNIPFTKISGLYSPYGVNAKVLSDAFSRLFIINEQKCIKGIALIEDMRNCFIYGGFNELKSIITSGNFTYNNSFFDVSKVMFIGEIDTNDLEECFNKKPQYTLENLEDNFASEHFADTEIRNIIEDLIAFNEEIDDPADIYSDQYKEAIKRSFLSAECNKVFGRKIYMEGLQLKDICKALKSPISELHTYKDDLLEEYISSDHFINSVAGHISESLIGLHDLDDAVREVSDYDSKRIKVYKKESLLSLNNGKN